MVCMKNSLLLACLGALAATAAQDDPAAQQRLFLNAVRKGDAPTVQSLLAANRSLVDAVADGVPAVRLALYYRRPEIARLLVDRGADLDFFSAAAMGDSDRLRHLLRLEPGLLNRLSADGATPLGLAAFFGHREQVEFLLDAGATINQAATNPAFPVVPLHSAMTAGHTAIVELLLARGADVNVREGGGITVLHEAAALGNLDYVRTLLARGANPAARTDKGELPEDLAQKANAPAIRELLVRARERR